MKTCRDCGVERLLEDISPSSKNKDGRTSYCRDCLRARHRGCRDAQRGGPPVLRRDHRPVAERTEKWCFGCSASLPVTAFGKNCSTTDALTAYCRPCHNTRASPSRERNGGARNYHLMRRYGITAQQLDAMVKAQGGVGALCLARTPEHVDHDHLTGAVRGVLCCCCNQGLGNRDDAATLRLAADYLERTTWQRHTEGTGVYRLTSPRPAVRRSPSSSALQHLISSRRAGPCPPG